MAIPDHKSNLVLGTCDIVRCQKTNPHDNSTHDAILEATKDTDDTPSGAYFRNCVLSVLVASLTVCFNGVQHLVGGGRKVLCGNISLYPKVMCY